MSFLNTRMQMKYRQKSIPLANCLTKCLIMAKDRIMLKNITVRKQYAVHDCKIVLNKSNMKIALTNIIINAIDAMSPKNGELKLVTKSIDGRYIIRIEDNGCGIRKEDLKYIFKPNYTKNQAVSGLDWQPRRRFFN